MSTAAACLIALLCLAAPTPEEVDGAIAELTKVDTVAGRKFGYGMQESAFWKLFEVLREAPPEVADELLEHENPVCRSMGLVLVARRGKEEAVPVLTRALRDRGPVWWGPYGCIVRRNSVGGVARELLHDAGILAAEKPGRPLLDADALRELDLDLLARDDAVLLHGHAAFGLRKERFDPDTADLRTVKAAGRMARQHEFLLAVLGNGKRPKEVRLAAASALARMGREELRGAEPFLRKAGAADLLVTLDLVREWEAGSKPDSRAVKTGHPTALEWAADELSLVAAGARKAPSPQVVQYLVRVVENLPPERPAWDAWGDAPYRVEAIFSANGPDLEKALGEERFAKLKARVKTLAK